MSTIKSLRQQAFEKRVRFFIDDNNLGTPKQNVEAFELLKVGNESVQKFGPSERKKEAGVDYYYYFGPKDSKNRDFCSYMLRLDKVFSEEEIQFMSDMLGYPVLEYAGSYNCRHRWAKFRGKFINTPAPTVRQIDHLIQININYLR